MPRGTQVCKYKIPLLRKAITRMRREKKVKRSKNHPAVGSMKARAVIDYLYDTAAALHWDWSAVISGPEKKTVAKKCKAAPGAGAIAVAPLIDALQHCLHGWRRSDYSRSGHCMPSSPLVTCNLPLFSGVLHFKLKCNTPAPFLNVSLNFS